MRKTRKKFVNGKGKGDFERGNYCERDKTRERVKDNTRVEETRGGGDFGEKE